MGDLSRGNAYFGGITGGTEKVISAGACAADKSLNIVLYRLVFDIWGATLMQKLQRVLGLMNTEISDIYSQ